MKKTIKLAVVAALALGTTSAFATNGSTMIGAGAKTRGMAGVGIGMSHGAESILVNPALITNVKSNEVSFGGTVFMPDVESKNSIGAPANTIVTAESTADFFVIPSVSVVTKINDNFYTGIGMWGTGGLGVDYRNGLGANTGQGQFQMVTSLQLMQFGVPLAYKSGSFSAAVTPVIQYGTLDINYDTDGNATNGTAGTGIGSDLQFGYTLGLSYETGSLTLGAVYKSEIEMTYDNVLSSAVTTMTTMLAQPAYTNNTLSVPSEVGVGLSYGMGKHTFAVDYKVINWESAAGYQDFGWEDQKVISLGYEYTTDAWAVRLGYSDANSAVKDNTNKTLALNSALTNTFNAVGFPGNIETHYAMGGTYNFSKLVSIDLAYVYAPESTNTYTSNAFGANPMSVKHSETSYSAQLNVAF